MRTYKFTAGRSYLISDQQKLNIIKISVLEYEEDIYYIYWHDEQIGQLCSKVFFDESFDLIKELQTEKTDVYLKRN